ncbi:response regulator [Rhodopseudomonas sp. HC1]|nr:response regulator [Rhodopseudomonas infernalis]
MLKIVSVVLSLDPSLETKGCLSCEEGMQAVTEWLPDLILSDVSMPGIGGLELLERLRNRTATRGIPVVFTTSRSRQNHVAQFMSCGVSGVIFKPFNLRDLIGSVRKYLDLTAMDQEDVMPPDVDIGRRLSDDAATLRELRAVFAAGDSAAPMRDVVHKLAGVAGLYGYDSISETAARLERVLDAFTRGTTASSDVVTRLDDLLEVLDRDNQPKSEQSTTPERFE